MKAIRRISVFPVALLLTVAGACHTLSSPISDDGKLKQDSSYVVNTGVQVLSLSAASTDIGVSEFQAITATYGGQVLINNGGMTSSVSDNSVLAGSAFGAVGLSVGGATITATYQGSTATISFNVHQYDGLSAIIAMDKDSTGATAWFPDTTQVQAGSFARFNTVKTHNVVFDSVPGAPPNIPLNVNAGQTNAGVATGFFSLVGTYPYHCTVHGEKGVVIVVPATP